MPASDLPSRPSSIVDAARHARRHPATIRRWISEGRIRAWRYGPAVVRVDLDDVDAVLAPSLVEMTP